MSDYDVLKEACLGYDEPGKYLTALEALDRSMRSIDREALRPVLEAENALSQAIFLADLAVKESRDHPSGPDFTTHYGVPHGLWAAVLRERQNLHHAIQSILWGRDQPGA